MRSGNRGRMSCHALAGEPDSRDPNGNNAPPMPTLASYCQGLITIEKEVSTLRLIHFTLQEYLSALRISSADLIRV